MGSEMCIRDRCGTHAHGLKLPPSSSRSGDARIIDPQAAGGRQSAGRLAFGRPGQTVPSLTGPAQELAEEMRAYAREGISHVQLYPDPCTVAGIEALAPMLELLDQA